MIIKRFNQLSLKNKAKVVLLYALMPFAWLIDNTVKMASCLLSRRKAVMSCIMVFAMLVAMIPLSGVPVLAATTYTATYTGSQGSVTLSSGNYLLEDVTFTVPAGQNGIAIAGGATVTLYISGTATVSVGKYTWSVYARGGFAGILVPSDSTLIIKKAEDASEANLKVTGGNGANAYRVGAGGGGAAIGTNGGDGGISNDTDGAKGGNGSSAGAIGTLNFSNEVKMTLAGGIGGNAGTGTAGSAAYTGRDGNGKLAAGGAGGDGGGGSGYNGASLGTGGGGGGAGGAGGKGSFDRWDMWAECSGGGGGGGGGGGASAANNGGQAHSINCYSGGMAGYNGYPTTAEKVSTHAAFSKERWATTGTGGQGGLNPDTDKKASNPGQGGAAGTTRDSGGELGGKGGNGGLAGKAAIEYTCIEFIDTYRNVTSYKLVVSGSAIGAFPTEPANPHYTFEGWYSGSTKVDETVKVSGSVYTLKSKWTELPHSFSYTANGNTVVAKCTLDGCEYSTNGVTLSINANACNKVYDGKSCASAKVTNGITSVTGAVAGRVFYVSTDGAGYNSSFAPKNAGAYKALVTIGRATAYQNFVITKANLYVIPSSHTVNPSDSLPTVQTSYSGFVNGETQSTAGITGVLPNIKFYTDSTKTSEITNTKVAGNYVIAYSGTGTLQATNYSFKYMTGTLTVGAVYEIYTAEQFLTFAQSVNNGATAVNAVLKNDIDLSSVCSKLSGKNWTPIGTELYPYTGNFDGNGFTVSGLYINSTKGEQALFGVNMGSKATITMTNCYNTSAITATKEGGGLAGWLGAAATIVSCYSTGVVTNGDAFARSTNNAATVQSSYVLDTLSTTFPVTAKKAQKRLLRARLLIF